MFEDSLMESQNRLSSPNQRWTTIASLSLQTAVAATIILLPLLHPEVLHLQATAPTITLPPKPPLRIPHLEPQSASTSSSAPATPSATSTLAADIRHLPSINSHLEDAPPDTGNIGTMTATNDLPGNLIPTTKGTGRNVTLAPAPTATGPVRISRGVSTGLLLAPIRPIYPLIAVSTHTEGVVVIEAVISKTGNIESAHATSGPALLRNAALDAVRNARYSPYLLNGLPTDVETTITVNFKLAG